MPEEHCNICNQLTTHQCEGCDGPYYCGTKCQTLDWENGHATNCTKDIGAFFGIGSWKGVVWRHTNLTIELAEALRQSGGVLNNQAEIPQKKLIDQVDEWTRKFTRTTDRQRLRDLLIEHITLVGQFVVAMIITQGKGSRASQAAAEKLGTSKPGQNGYEIVQFWLRKSRNVGRWYTRERDYKDAWDKHISCTAAYVTALSKTPISPFYEAEKNKCLEVAYAMGHVFNGGRRSDPTTAGVYRFAADAN